MGTYSCLVGANRNLINGDLMDCLGGWALLNHAAEEDLEENTRPTAPLAQQHVLEF